MLTIPEILDTPEFYDAPLNYKWSKDIFYRWEDEVENDKLQKALLKMNHKSILGITAALAEWIFWRLHTNVNLSLPISTIEPLWAGLADKRYLKAWNYGNKGETDHVGGVKRLTLDAVEQIRIAYKRGHYRIQRYLVGLAMLARHISPDKVFFDKWISDCLSRAIKLFPVQYDRNSPSEYGDGGKPYYDSSRELPIPREFFFTIGLDYEKEDIPRLLNDYLSKLSWEGSDFLTPPEEMLEQGFQGTPYKYEPK